ncbi:MAG TPA: CaiB/BaiF CoA-transferase family protein [Paenalcaligenes sp.]|nr:CaiB/BaiF CoA-transferase family protein [Paenalcaligenes sp.]
MSSQSTKGLPLHGVKVLDLSRVMAGPFCTQALGDLGADVIKVEHPVRGDDTRDWGQSTGTTSTTYYNSINRNKRSIAIDLKTEQGLQLALELAKNCDVVIHNFKHGGIDRLGLGFDDVRKINPGVIYCSITGYNTTGPEAERPGYDLVIQGEAGLMAMNGEKGQGPLKFGVAIVDMFTGMFSSQAILAALYERERTGEGKQIEMCLFDSGIMVQSYYGLEALQSGHDPDKVGNDHPTVVPYGVFDAKDGPIVLAVGNNAQFERFCRDVIQRPDIAEDPDFKTNQLRSVNREKLMPLLKQELLKHARADLLKGLHAAQIPCGEVLGMHEALLSERSEQSQLVVRYDSDKGSDSYCLAPPYRINGERVPLRRTPPELAQDTQTVLQEVLGLDAARIDALTKDKIIR